MAGTWILVPWLVILVALRVGPREIPGIFRLTFSQMWGALIVAPVIFGLATVFNFSGMANTLAHGFAQIGPAFLILAPVIGFIGVALSGSNTSTNALPWTLFMLGYLILIALFYRGVLPAAMQP